MLGAQGEIEQGIATLRNETYWPMGKRHETLKGLVRKGLDQKAKALGLLGKVA